jgi:hypothetical protein
MTAIRGIYKPLGLDRYELCHPVDDRDFERIHVEINGERRSGQWRPLRMKLICEDEGKELRRSDSPWLGSHALILRPEAAQLLGPTLLSHGELLPLSCSEPLVIYNPTDVIDGVDEANSRVTRFSTGGIIMFHRYVFVASLVAQADIFKIPNLRVSPTFVSHRFVDQWNALGLKGLEFVRVWDAPSTQD